MPSRLKLGARTAAATKNAPVRIKAILLRPITRIIIWTTKNKEDFVPGHLIEIN
jgi:hypothetical protein